MRVRCCGNHHQPAASVVGGGPQAVRSNIRCHGRICQQPSNQNKALAQAQQRRLSVCLRASGDNNDNGGEGGSSSAGIPAALFLFVGSAAYTLTNMRDELADVLYNDDDSISEALAALGFAGFGLGDATGALLWAVALWYLSPVQLLLVFLGNFDTERPSDWLMNILGRATQQPVDAIDYQVPFWIKAAAAAACLTGGVAAAGVLEAGLGDPTWSISSGIGALFAAGIFEVGRPKRLSVAEAQTLESQWQDFAGFADVRLQRSGRCHESEVFTAFRQRFGKYRSADVMPDSTLRDMVALWAAMTAGYIIGFVDAAGMVDPATQSTHLPYARFPATMQVALWAAMTAGYIIGFVDAAGMVDPATLPFFMNFYNKVASASVTQAAVQQQELLTCRYPNPCWCDVSSTARAWFVTLRMAATAAAALPAAWLSRLAGRRAATCTGVVLVLAGQILQASAQQWVQLLLGTLLIGLGIAPLLHSTWVECAEIAPPQWRAGFLAASAVGRSCGLWACMLCMSAMEHTELPQAWRVVVALGAWPALVMLLLIIWLPETPNSLIQRGRLAEGRDMLRIIRGPFYDCNKELVDIWKSAGRPSHVMKSKVGIMMENLRELWQRSSLPPLFVSSVLALFIQAAGSFKLMAYALSPLLQAIFPEHANLIGASVVGAAGTIGCLIAVAATAFVSPRAIITCGCSAAAATWLAIGLGLHLITAAAAEGAPAAASAVMLALFATNVAASGGLLSMFPVVATENQPLSTRAHAVAIAIGLDYLMHGVSTAFKAAMLCKMATRSLFLAAASNLVVAVFTLLLLPNTKHVQLELINQRWAKHWLWKRVYNKRQQPDASESGLNGAAAAGSAGPSGGIFLQDGGSLQLSAVGT
ncbi:hypothetical protein OEZ85_000590 [Tetradesmus obliquus]|uniref:Major facilitator superfamily (MFS) profile domain-containing protein n=1 Tax=Tetradesmus obliquus TaxID=3088 RepID=A0ABY8UIQ1_TETOB|nr:hypothetical protein OEZ85_000590 [Tetradesmus obliquus]